MIRIIGDTHGDINILRRAATSMGKDDYIIVTGDFGFIWNEYRTPKALKEIEQLAPTILFIDGNHENFEMLDRLPTVTDYLGGNVGHAADNVFHLRRGESYNIDGYTFFTMGGAVSIDRHIRVHGISWWPREVPSKEEYQHALETIEKHKGYFDYIITHTCPNEPLHTILDESYPCEVSDFLDIVSEKCTCEMWLFGHLHEDAVGFTKGQFYRALCDEWYDIEPKSGSNNQSSNVEN